jgi:hypothetical protein
MRISSHYTSILLAITLACSVVSCGKVGQPKAPEYFAPEIVGEYSVSLVPQGIALSWKAPKNDRRGKELKEIDGYSVERAILAPEDTVATAKFSELAFVTDGHILERDKLRASLRAQHKPSRSADVSGEKKLFSYVDTSAEAKDRNLNVMYRIVGINYGSVRGARSKIAYKKGDALVMVNNEDGADLLSNDE